VAEMFFSLQIVTENMKTNHALKKLETTLYHEFLHCFVELSLYFLLHTPV
jgi:hypothetical protein